MTEVIVEHEWKDVDGESVMKVVGSVIDMQKNGSLPQGFALKGIQLLRDKNRAICTWDAPSGSALSELLGKLSPPTIHTVTEINRVL